MVEPGQVLAIMWGAWAISWLMAALWSTQVGGRPPPRDEGLYRLLTFIAALLVFWPFDGPHPSRLWETPGPLDWLLLAVATAGFCFTWWARLHIGVLWSGGVARKVDHRIIDTGPYGLVRHPIYTGLLIALYATAAQRGTGPALVGAVLATVAFIIKARLEERFLCDELGPDTYDSYRARVPMLVPFWPMFHG